MRRRPSLLALVLACWSIPAQLPAQPNQTIVRVGHLIDVERGRILQDQILTIGGERIEWIGPASEFRIPPSADIVDLSIHYVLPGLIDAHVHLLSDADEAGFRRLANSVPRATVKGVRNARLTLLAGFTSARMPGAPGFGDVALRDGIEEGEIIGPRLLVAGPSIGITGGHCSDYNLLAPQYTAPDDGIADGPWAVRAAVRRNVKFGADFIKTCSTGGVMSAGTEVGLPQYTVEELAAMVDEAHSHGRKVASHAHGAAGIRNAIIAGIDSIEHASFIDSEGITLARDAGTTLVMDVYVTEYILSEGESAGILPESLEKERTVGQTQRDNFRLAHEAGVNIVFGTDAGVYPHGQNARQFGVMVDYGMTPLEAIQAATIKAAALLGTEADVGSLESGKYADLIAVRANPLEDVTLLEEIPFVMKGGVIYKQGE